MEAQANMSSNENSARAEKIAKVRESNIYKDFSNVFSRANKNKPQSADVEKLKTMLRDNPDLELWRKVSGLAGAAEIMLLGHDSISPGLREVSRLRMANQREELGYTEAPPVEQLLISHIVLCWLRMNILGLFGASLLNQEVMLTKAMFWEKRLEQAPRRFTRAVESLAKVRARTAATRLMESCMEAASAAKRVNNLRALKALSS
jgi:hypothetical protein